MRNTGTKVSLILFTVFFVYCIFRPATILPSFLKNIVPLSALDKVIYPILWLPFFAFAGVLAYIHSSWKKSKSNGSNKPLPLSKVLMKCMPYVMGSIAIVLVVCDLMTMSARETVKDFVANVSSSTMVEVNGQTISNPNETIDELKTLAPMAGHGSHATKKVEITISDAAKTLTLEIGRDSKRPQEYWVFYPKYRYTSKNEIGRITTDIFNDY